MDLKYRRSESMNEQPSVERGKTVVYLRKDFTTEVRDGITFYICQEATLSHSDFDEYMKTLSAKNSIENVNKIKTLDENQIIIMEAIADLYDAIATFTTGGA